MLRAIDRNRKNALFQWTMLRALRQLMLRPSLYLMLSLLKSTLQLRVEQLRVGVAEAVYALLHISDNQTVVAVCQTVSDKRQQIFPLHPRRVLKLVEQEIVQIHADALIDERRLTPIDDALHDVVCAGEQYCVVLVGEILHAGVDVAQQTELVGEVKNLLYEAYTVLLSSI